MPSSTTRPFPHNTWLPRVSADIGPWTRTSYRNNLALVKGAMAMNNYSQPTARMSTSCARCGTVSAIAGIFKAPFDILADKLRGYIGLTMDMIEQPDKVLKACEALMPHLYNVALTSSDLARQVPIGYWMHRGCIPFCLQGAVRVTLLANHKAHHRGALAAGPSDALLCRRQLGTSPAQSFTEL